MSVHETLTAANETSEKIWQNCPELVAQSDFLRLFAAMERHSSGSGSSMLVVGVFMLGLVILVATYTGNLIATLAGELWRGERVKGRHQILQTTPAPVLSLNGRALAQNHDHTPTWKSGCPVGTGLGNICGAVGLHAKFIPHAQLKLLFFVSCVFGLQKQFHRLSHILRHSQQATQ